MQTFARHVTKLWPAAGLLLAACASPAPENAMLREVDFGAAQPIVDPGGAFTTELSLDFEQESDEDGTLQLAIPLEGSAVPMYCFVWTDECELGVTAVRTSRQILRSVEGDGIEISGLKTHAVESGVLGDAPYQAVVSSFQLAGDGELGNGLMKVAAANKGGRGIACNHWDAGYSKSFMRAFEQLVGSFEATKPGPAPYHKEIHTIHLGQLTVGIATASLTRDADGDIEAISQTSMVVPSSASEFHVSYSKDTDWTRPDGTLINAYATESDLDAETTNLALKWEDDQWRAEGLFSGKEFSATLEHAKRIDSMVSDLFALQQLAPFGPATKTNLVRWIPGMDPSRVVDFGLVALEGREALLKLGPVEMNVLRDAQGLPEQVDFKLGAHDLSQKRVYLHVE